MSVPIYRMLMYALAGAVAMAAAAFVVDIVLYQIFILPRLSSVNSIPIGWWTILLTPLAISLLLLGYVSGSFGLVLASASGSTIGLMVYEFVVARLNRAGHLKSLAVEDSAYFFTTELAIRFTIILITVLVGFIGRRVMHRAAHMSI